jgi:predicted RNA-binding protein YlxR (DUF448 family)
MTRVVRATDGSVSVDPSGRAAGRGTYVCDQASCREPKALQEGIQRALGAAISPDRILAEMTHASA